MRNGFCFVACLLLIFASFSLAQKAQPASRALGSVTSLGSAPCLSGVTTGATCTTIQVTCPGIPALNATMSQAVPSGTAKGTIVLMSAQGGTAFFNSNFADTYVNSGYNVVQIGWATDWEDTGGVGLVSAACRSATAFASVFSTVHKKSRTAGFCAQGISGGGASIAYSLAEYGTSGFFDYVVIGAGPGVARMDYGCDKSLYTGPALNLCPLITSAPYDYFKGDKVNSWENTASCATKNPPPADINKWAADSIVSSGAVYKYPKTGMSFFYCATNPNSSTGQGKFLVDQVTPKNLPVDVNCYSGVCQGEAVWQDTTAFNTTVTDMLTQCIPNH